MWDRQPRAFTPEEVARLDAYFEQHREEFDLLHPTRPFLGHPAPAASGPTALAKLFHAEASGNNPTLFDHALDDAPRALAPAVVARGLVAAQAFAVGGGKSVPFYYSDAPLLAGAIFWLRGRSLYEAFLLNTPPDEKARIQPVGNDRPAWEREALQPPSARRAEGYTDYLTWTSRLIHFEAEERDGQVLVTGMRMSQGDKLDAPALRDPLMAYRDGKTGLYPFKFNPDRVLWRDAAVFLRPTAKNGAGAAAALNWVANTAALERDADMGEARFTLDVFGLANDKGDVLLWRHERMPFYPAVLRDPERFSRIEQALGQAEQQRNALRDALFHAAAKVLFPDKDPLQKNPQAPDALSENARKDAGRVRDGMDGERRYWARLEAPFYAWLGRLAVAPPDLPVLERLLAEWTRTLHREAQAAYDEATEHLDTSPRHLRARVEGRARLRPAAAYAHLLSEPEPA